MNKDRLIRTAIQSPTPVLLSMHWLVDTWNLVDGLMEETREVLCTVG